MSQAATKHVHIAPVKSNIDPVAKQGILQRLSPHWGTLHMNMETKGLFVPYPILTIVVTLALALITGLVTLEVQVSNLNTTILLRDADGRAQLHDLQEKMAQMEVYMHDLREKRIADRSDIDQLKDKRR